MYEGKYFTLCWQSLKTIQVCVAKYCDKQNPWLGFAYIPYNVIYDQKKTGKNV